MNNSQLLTLLDELKNTLPSFPDGRINYHNAPKAPVVTVFVLHNGKILLMKRSENVHTFKGKWHTVAGYIDEKKPVESIMLKELKEETGIAERNVLSIRLAPSFSFEHDKTTWIVFPGLAEIDSSAITRNAEHSEHIWICPNELNTYDTVPMLPHAWDLVSSIVEDEHTHL